MANSGGGVVVLGGDRRGRTAPRGARALRRARVRVLRGARHQARRAAGHRDRRRGRRQHAPGVHADRSVPQRRRGRARRLRARGSLFSARREERARDRGGRARLHQAATRCNAFAMAREHPPGDACTRRRRGRSDRNSGARRRRATDADPSHHRPARTAVRAGRSRPFTSLSPEGSDPRSERAPRRA